MSLDLDMKEIERKAYMSYSEDGLVDIAIGFVILGWGISLVLGPAGLITLLGPIALAMWYLGKRYLTIPRIGIIKPSRKMAHRARNGAIVLLLLGTITLAGILLGIVVGGSDLADYSLAILGLLLAAGICVIAFLLNSNRLYVYAVLLFVAFAGGQALNDVISSVDTFIVSVILAGALILLSGAVVLVRFLRKYPLPVIGAEA
jgi:hypothetical protein